jgi:hypothetical protein
MLGSLVSVSVARADHLSAAGDRAVEYLQRAQSLDGGFGGETRSGANFTAWVAIALAAAGINPRDQRQPGGQTAYAYLVEHADEMSYTTDFERELLVVDASGTSPHDFGGVDLVERILEREIQEPAEGGAAFPHEAGSSRAGMNDTIFAVIALSPVHEPAAEAAVRQASSWIEHEQNNDGGWPAECPKTVAGCSQHKEEAPSEVDMTAAAIEALEAAGRDGTTAEQRAFRFLHDAQSSSEGGFVEWPGEGRANTGSTAWVTQAIWAAGQNPEAEEWTQDAADPLTYLESTQHADGGMGNGRGEAASSVWMTAYAGPALFGDPLPVPAAPYTELPIEPQASGSGGEGSQAGSGVDAGGGANGAELFSRPQPGSTGAGAGGVRVLGDSSQKRPRRDPRHHRSPGRPRRDPLTTSPTAARDAADRLASAAARPATQRARKPAHSAAATGAGARGIALATPGQGRSTASSRREISGIAIGSPAAGSSLEATAAPGLRGAGQKESSPLLALAICAAMAVLALCGSLLERHRPRSIA